jgi:TIR domain
MGEVFLSYSRRDKDDASKVRQRLEALGVKVWIDKLDLQANEDISVAIDSKIASVDAVLVLWSTASKESNWVRGEALSGLSSNKYIAALIEPIAPSVPFNARNAADLSDWAGSDAHEGWDLLVRGLAGMLGDDAPAILRALEAAQASEAQQIAHEAATQDPLPLEVLPEPEAPLEEEHAYRDVDALLAIVEGAFAGAGRPDLSRLMIQAALDQELIRSASFIVSPEPSPVSGFSCPIVGTIGEALARASDNALIVVQPGTYIENIKIKRPVRIVGLGLANQRAKIIAKVDDYVVDFQHSGRLENLSIETRKNYCAIHCADKQPVIVRCEISQFAAKKPGSEEAAFYVAGKANPIVIASSITSSDRPAMYFVRGSGGTFVGVTATVYRGSGIRSRGHPTFRSCRIETVGGHAVEVLGQGWPTFESCEIAGRGAPVFKIVENASPRIRDSKLSVVRQLAFDFDGSAGGRYERNIIYFEDAPDAGTAKPQERGFFGGLFRARQDALVSAETNRRILVSLKTAGSPVFLSNKMADGTAFELPKQKKSNEPSARK